MTVSILYDNNQQYISKMQLSKNTAVDYNLWYTDTLNYVYA